MALLGIPTTKASVPSMPACRPNAGKSPRGEAGRAGWDDRALDAAKERSGAYIGAMMLDQGERAEVSVYALPNPQSPLASRALFSLSVECRIIIGNS